jgi:hypothetical protein
VEQIICCDRILIGCSSQVPEPYRQAMCLPMGKVCAPCGFWPNSPDEAVENLAANNRKDKCSKLPGDR